MRCPWCNGSGEIVLQRSQCRSCAAVIVWTETMAGRNMPVDLEPSSTAGNVALTPRPAGPPLSRVLNAADAQQARHEGAELYVSHFSTCPNAEQHRRRA